MYQASGGVQVEKDTWFDVKLVMNATTMTASLFVNDQSCGERGYTMNASKGSCGFRFGNGSTGAKFYVDDFKITEN